VASLTEVTAGVQLIPSGPAGRRKAAAAAANGGSRRQVGGGRRGVRSAAGDRRECCRQARRQRHCAAVNLMRDATLDREYIAGALPQISALRQCAWRQPTCTCAEPLPHMLGWLHEAIGTRFCMSHLIRRRLLGTGLNSDATLRQMRRRAEKEAVALWVVNAEAGVFKDTFVFVSNGYALFR